VPSPTPQGGRLFGVAALSPSKVYAVGQAPNIPSLVMRWNGSSWTTETTPTTGTVWDAAAVGPGTVWAVGQRGNPNVGVSRTFTPSHVQRLADRSPTRLAGGAGVAWPARAGHSRVGRGSRDIACPVGVKRRLRLWAPRSLDGH
jgi:hypothetical protein